MRYPTMEEFNALPAEERLRRMEGLAQTFESAAQQIREQNARMQRATQSPSDKNH